MKIFILIALFLFPVMSFAYCTGRGDCCRCPGQAQDLGSHSSCEEACGLTKGSGGGSTSPTGGIGLIIGNEIGKEINKSLFGDPEEEAREAARLREQQHIQAEINQRAEIENSQRLEESKNRVLGGLMGVEESDGGLALMTDENDKSLPMNAPVKQSQDCKTPVFEVSNMLSKFHQEAKVKAYTFIASDIGNEVLSKEALQGMRGQEYKEFHQKTKKNVDRLKNFDDELSKIQSCLKLKECNLIELNKKINAEFGSWLKEQLKQSTQNAIERVKDAKSFLKDYVKRIGKANENALKNASSCDL